MQFLMGVILWIILGVATWFVASFITSIIGYDGNIVFWVSYAIVIAAMFYILTKHHSNKEKNIIKKWSQRGYESAIAMLNNILPEEYRTTSDEESLFKKIFDGSINEAKKRHFDTNAKDTEIELLKNEELWLIETLRDYCADHCSWGEIEEGQIQMLNYVGEYSELKKEFGRVYYYDKYEFTDSGIVAEKIMLARAILKDSPDSLFQNAPKYKGFIDEGYLSEFKRYEEYDQNN